MKYLLWLLKAAIFFTLFAFALNNQQEAVVNFFFGTHWQAPLVLVVLTAFVAGLIAGVLVMVPRWWMHRSTAAKLRKTPDAQPGDDAQTVPPTNDPLPPNIHGI
ncbi:MAG: LapA family protein [Comamonas sp.]|nr:LapA family protein [Candidatus Comamonas equi]